MYKLSTSEFGIAQQYVHVQSVDVPDEVITYDAEGTALVYKEVDSSKGINRMVYPFLGANTSMTLYVENPGAYWIFVGNKRFYAVAGSAEVPPTIEADAGKMLSVKSDGSGTEWRNVVNIVTEPPAEGTNSNIISVILAE